MLYTFSGLIRVDRWTDGRIDGRIDGRKNRDNEWMMVDVKWMIDVGMDVEMGGWMDGK